MAARNSTRRRRAKTHARAALPDLTPILHAFYDARALITAAYMVLKENNRAGMEESVLRQGIGALDQVYNRIEQAGGALSRFRRGKR